ncbi:MAG: TIM barrel protein [Caldilineaceae bacterium]
MHRQPARQRRSPEDEHQRNKAGLQIAAGLGIGCTLHTLGRLRPDLYYDDAYRNGVRSLQAIAETAEALGVALAVEFVWNGFLFSPLEMRHFLDEVGSPQIGFYFDPGNMAVFQYPHHWVCIVGDHIKMVHLKDWQGRAQRQLAGVVERRSGLCGHEPRIARHWLRRPHDQRSATRCGLLCRDRYGDQADYRDVKRIRCV